LGDLQELVLVQLHGGLLAGDDAAGLTGRTYGLAASFDGLFGRQIARVEEPFDRRFPFAEDVGYGLYAGHVPDGPVLVSAGLRLNLLRFNADGRMIQERALNLNTPGQALAPRELLRLLRDELGFVPGPIFVREFEADDADLSVYLWGTYEDVVADPDARSDGDEHEEACASLHRYWMTGGNYVVYSGTDYWAGPDGTIHSS
jgi:hypothetical protein